MQSSRAERRMQSTIRHIGFYFQLFLILLSELWGNLCVCAASCSFFIFPWWSGEEAVLYRFWSYQLQVHPNMVLWWRRPVSLALLYPID
jgi:hypothetical protein